MIHNNRIYLNSIKANKNLFKIDHLIKDPPSKVDMMSN